MTRSRRFRTMAPAGRGPAQARPARGRQAWARPARARWLPLATLLAATIGFLALGLGEARSDSPTFDEPVYVAAGLAAILHHDLTFNDEHPPVPKVLAALPVLLANPVIPGNGRWSGNDERSYSARFAHAQLAAGRLRVVTFAARLVPLAESAGVAFAAYGLGAELFGTTAGAFAGLLWLASPLVLGIGHLHGTDIPFALAVTLCSWALARWLRLRTARALASAGLAMTAAAGTEMSGLLVVLAGLTVIVVASWPSGARRACASAGRAAAITWACLWVSYAALDPSVMVQPTILVPRPYLDGIAYLASYHAAAAPGYLAGLPYTGSRWWFWPLSLLIKFPAASLALLLAGTFAWCCTDRAARRRLLLAVGIPAFPLVIFTLTSPLNIGIRLLLPVIALWAAAASALVPAVSALSPAAPRALGGAAAARIAVGRPAACAAVATLLAAGAHRHRPLIPGLDCLDGATVPAGLRGGHRFQYRLGAGALRPAVLEPGPAPVGELLRSSRAHGGRGARCPRVAGHAARPGLGLGRGICDRTEHRRPHPAGLAPRLLPGRRSQRIGPHLPLPETASRPLRRRPVTGPPCRCLPRHLESFPAEPALTSDDLHEPGCLAVATQDVCPVRQQDVCTDPKQDVWPYYPPHGQA